MLLNYLHNLQFLKIEDRVLMRQCKFIFIKKIVNFSIEVFREFHFLIFFAFEGINCRKRVAKIAPAPIICHFPKTV